jgi:peptidoglycan/xylan/chitin deacetylase (PgdA/CDA1 family)
MKREKSTCLLVLLLLAGCHSRYDTGPFRLRLDTIEPAHTGVLQRMAYRKPILLTFDDGPENLADDRSILATLAKHHAHALWLVTCRRLDPSMDPQAAEHRIALQQIVAQGHLIGNHGFSHVDLRPLGAAALHHEIAGCSELIAHLTGSRPVYFRPPFGVHTPQVDRTIRANRMQLLLWGSIRNASRLMSPRIRPSTWHRTPRRTTCCSSTITRIRRSRWTGY